ncbi:MAG: ribonuclease Y [Planctomycetota bacterium]|jgi:ribonuclease Y
MNMEVITALVGAAGGVAIGYVIRHLMGMAKLAKAETQAASVVDDATRKAEAVTREAETKARSAAEDQQKALLKDIERERDKFKETERKLEQREQALNQQVNKFKRNEKFLKRTERSLADQHEALVAQRTEADQTLAELQEQLEAASGMTGEQARQQMLERAQAEIAHEEAMLIKRQIERVKEGVDHEARRVIANTIQRVASEYTSEITTAPVDLPSDDVKGRIIGKEGRNIRHFEKVTGCDVIVDDTPGVVIISCFEGVRREVGRRAMARLVKDGRVHPARIEEVVESTQKDLEKIINETGEKVLMDLDIQDVHPEVVNCVGRLQFRTSFGQNVLLHSIEVGEIAKMIASEIGLDPKLALRCGILHDIGKAVDQSQQGSHPELGGEIAKRCGEREEVVEAVAGHHDDVEEVKFAYTVLANAADAISASRPGARRDNFERYVERLRKLEEISDSFHGVKKSFAIQAGREVRIIASPDQLTDDEMQVTARQIARRIEDEVTYPGEVRVTLLRERRVVEYAR